MRCIFLFRRNRTVQLQDWQKKLGPADFLYGFPFINSDHFKLDFVEGDDDSKNWIRYLCYPLETAISRVVEIGFSIHIVLIHWRRIQNADVIISTVDTCGLPIAFFKWLKLISKPVLYISQGLAHRLSDCKRHSNFGKLFRYLYAMFFNSLERVIVLGDGSVSSVVRELEVSSDKIFVLQFGVDDQFWVPDYDNGNDNYIFSIGTDAARDYDTLINVIGDYPLKIVSRHHFPQNLITRNIDISHQHTFLELKTLYQRSRFVVIPLHDVDQPSGQSAALQAMACGRPVIISQTKGLWDPEHMIHRETCYLVESGNEDDLRKTIDYVYDHPLEAEVVGRNGRALVENRYSARLLANDLQRHILEIYK